MRPHQSKAREKELRGQSVQFRRWRQWRRERLEALSASPHYGEPMQALLDFIKHTKSPSELIDMIRLGPWFGADDDVRFLVLSLIDAVIVRKREKLGKAPFDNSLPGERNSVFLILREMLAPNSALTAAPPGAKPGSINKDPQTIGKSNERFSTA